MTEAEAILRNHGFPDQRSADAAAAVLDALKAARGENDVLRSMLADISAGPVKWIGARNGQA